MTGGTEPVIIDQEPVFSKLLNRELSHEEINAALVKDKRGKAVGNERIPAKVFCNSSAQEFLVCLFQKCFNVGVVSTEWSKGVINPHTKVKYL